MIKIQPFLYQIAAFMFLYEFTGFIFELSFKYLPCFILLNLCPSIFISAAINIVYFPIFKPDSPSLWLIQKPETSDRSEQTLIYTLCISSFSPSTPPPQTQTQTNDMHVHVVSTITLKIMHINFLKYILSPNLQCSKLNQKTCFNNLCLTWI